MFQFSFHYIETNIFVRSQLFQQAPGKLQSPQSYACWPTVPSLLGHNTVTSTECWACPWIDVSLSMDLVKIQLTSQFQENFLFQNQQLEAHSETENSGMPVAKTKWNTFTTAHQFSFQGSAVEKHLQTYTKKRVYRGIDFL